MPFGFRVKAFGPGPAHVGIRRSRCASGSFGPKTRRERLCTLKAGFRVEGPLINPYRVLRPGFGV